MSDQVKIQPWMCQVSVVSIGPDENGQPTLFGETTHKDYSATPTAHNDKVMGFVGGIMGAAANMVEQARKANS